MAWIELHQSTIRHPKIIRAAATLGVSRLLIVGHLAALWCWALDAKPDGGPLTDLDIRTGAEWGERKDFTAALVDAGLLDAETDGLWIHDWDEYAGRLIRQRAMARDRARRSRGESPQRARSVRAEFASTQPNPTQPDPKGSLPAASPQKKPIKRVTVVDEAFIEEMISKHSPVPAGRIRDEIADALGHTAALKRTDLKAYVRVWLSRSNWNATQRPYAGKNGASPTYSGVNGHDDVWDGLIRRE